MDGLGQKGRIFSGNSDDLLVEAYAPLENKDEYRRIAFRVSMVDYILEVDDRISCIVLKSGGYIPAALSFDALKRAVYQPDFRTGDSIDLTVVTGEAVAQVKMDFVARSFDMNSQAEEDKELEIRAILRKSSSNEFTVLTFSEKDVYSLRPQNGTRAKQKQSVAIVFNNVAKKHPFLVGNSYLNIDMNHEDLLAEIARAKKEGRGLLDLVQLFGSNPKKYGFTPE